MNSGPERPRFRGWLRAILDASLAAVLLMVFVVSGVAISGDSMEPTLRDGERALVPRYEIWLRRLGVGEFARGDVVFFPSPEQPPGALCPVLCTHLIKRIVAVAGDTVAISRGQLLVNGQAVTEPYLGSGWHGSFSMEQQLVPEDHVFVLGDNRLPYGSFDSRAFGPIPTSRIEGRAAWVVWPLLTRDEEGRLRWNPRRVARGIYPADARRPSSSSSAARSCMAVSTNCT